MFKKAKYIILDDMTPIVFPITLQHDEVARRFTVKLTQPEVTSAGMVELTVTNGKPAFECYGRSISLDIDSKETDSATLNKMLGGYDEG